MEFILSSNVEELGLQPISFNYEELKTELESKLAYYNSLIVTEDTIGKGKEERANLNKLKTAIDDKRKEIEKEFNKPLETLKSQCKELVGMIDTASKSIDKQVKSFEDAEKEKKTAEIENIFAEHVGELQGLVTLEKIFDARWLNKGSKLKEIDKEIKDKIFKIDNEIKIIKLFDTPDNIKQELISGYLNHFDMSKVMQSKALLEERHARLAELEAKKAEIAAQQAQRQVEPPVTAAEKPQDKPVAASEGRDLVVYFIDTTAEFRAEMRELCIKHAIKYRNATQEDIK